MEAFSLLKYWRGGGGCDSTAGCGPRTTVLTAAAAAYPGTESDTESDGDDDGPFFDLEFAVHDGDEEEEGPAAVAGGECEKRDSASGGEEDLEGEGDEGSSEVLDGEEGAAEFDFALSPSMSSSSSAASFASGDGCAGGSPSDDLFFKGRLVPIEPVGSSSEPDSNNNTKAAHLPVSLVKSATRLRVFMSGLKKPRSDQPEKSQTGSGGKLLAVKLKVEEVPIISLFARDSSSSRSQKQSAAALPLEEGAAAAAGHSSDEKIFFSKEALQRYLKKVKPLYVRVSKRYGEKLRFSTSGQLGAAGRAHIDRRPRTPGETGAACVKGPIMPGAIPAGLRVVCKHLGKSRSASSAVAAAPSGPSSSSRRDDSLLQQQDGIQSAILHCKRSFNASRDSDASLLGRSASEPLQDRSTELLSRREIIEVNRDA